MIDRPTSLSLLGTEVRASGELRLSRLTTDDTRAPIASMLARAFVTLNVERPFERGRLVFFGAGGAVGATGMVPAQELLYFGGPVSAPGYGFHELAGLAGATTRLEWRTRVPAPAVSLGRFGHAPGTATIAPFAQATWARPATLASSHARPDGVYPSVGVALQPFFDLVRFQVARGVRHGAWTFNVDITRDFWGIF